MRPAIIGGGLLWAREDTVPSTSAWWAGQPERQSLELSAGPEHRVEGTQAVLIVPAAGSYGWEMQLDEREKEPAREARGWQISTVSPVIAKCPEGPQGPGDIPPTLVSHILVTCLL